MERGRTESAQALESEDPWKRYWGWIVCSCFGRQASPQVNRAQAAAVSDDSLLVRVRAAEFLGLTGAADPREAILEALYQSQSGIEVGLILNSIVLLRDRDPSYTFSIDPAKFSAEVLAEEIVQRRLEYLTGYQSVKPGKPDKKNKRTKS